MAVQPPNKTLQQDKDIVVTTPMVTGDTDLREQASVVLKNFDDAIQKEIVDRIADVNAEEERALLAEAYLAKLIEEERAARLLDAGGVVEEEEDGLAAEILMRQAADTNLSDAIYADRDPLNIILSTQSAKAVYVAPAYEQRIDPVSGDPKGRVVIPNGNDVSSFSGAHINFSTGTINSVPSFTPASFAGYEGSYGRYLIILLPNDSLEVKVPSEFNINSIQSPYPPLATNGILVGSVVVKDDGQGGVGTIANIDLMLVSYFKDSMGASGASAPVINTSALEIQGDEPYVYYTKSDFQEDKGDLVDSTTGQNSIANNNEIVLDASQTFTTKDLIGTLAQEDATYLNKVQAKILYKNGNFDKNAIVKFSNDGGANWKTAINYFPGSSDPNTYKGNLLLAECTFTPSSQAHLVSNASNGLFTSGSKVAAIIANTYGMLIDGFTMPIKTSSISGTVKGYLYEVLAGTPQGILRASAETFTCGTDIDVTAKEIKFSFNPMFLEKDKGYALVIEGTSINGALDVEMTSSSAFNLSSAVITTGGWIVSANAVSCKVFGSGYELLMKVQSGTALTKVAGFGVNYVGDTSFMLRGEASWEDRVVTANEALTGTVVLNQVRFVPGIRQLHANIEGKVYFAPDFLEVSAGEVKFPETTLIEGQTVRFYNTYGLITNTVTSSGGGGGGGGGSGSIQTGEELPEAAESYRGTLFLLLGGSQNPDILYVCTKDYNDNYAWNELVLIS